MYSQDDPLENLIKNSITANNLYLINKAVEKQNETGYFADNEKTVSLGIITLFNN